MTSSRLASTVSVAAQAWGRRMSHPAAYAQANDSFYAALTLLDNKAYPQALEAIDKAIQIYFNDPVFYWVKAEIAEQSGNIELAMFSLKQGVELHAHFIPFHVRMARLLMGQKKI